MKAYVTSIGESTTELCIWSLKRNGFDVVLIKDKTSLAEKLKRIYNQEKDEFIRVDADVVPNRRLTPEAVRKALDDPDAWWIQFRSYGWFTQGIIYGGMQYIRKEALPHLRNNVDSVLHAERPETQLSRIPEFYNPRRFMSSNLVMGLHGYAQNDIERIKQTKLNRNQYANYDWDLVEELGKL